MSKYNSLYANNVISDIVEITNLRGYPKNAEFDLVRLVLTCYNKSIDYNAAAKLLNINSTTLSKLETASKRAGYSNMSDLVDDYLDNTDYLNDYGKGGVILIPTVDTEDIGYIKIYNIFIDAINESSFEELHGVVKARGLMSQGRYGNLMEYVIQELMMIHSVRELPESIGEIKRLVPIYSKGGNNDQLTQYGIADAYTWYRGTIYYYKPKYEPSDIKNIEVYSSEVLEYIIDVITSKDVVIKKLSPTESLYD